MTPALSPETAAFLKACGVFDMDSFLRKSAILEEFLYETNKSFNLTSIPQEEYWTKHVADSLSLSLALPPLASGSLALADLGCGAGFPSLILASAFPSLEIAAIDSTRKKADFVLAASRKMGLGNLRAIHGRGRELGRKAPWKGGFHVVCARAVAGLQTLLKESEGLLSRSGTLAVYRTPAQAEEELASFGKAKDSGLWKVEASKPFGLPERAGERLFLICVKRRAA